MIDIDIPTIKYAKIRTKLSSIISNAISIPFQDNIFDYVISLEVIEHITDSTNYLYEIKRILKKKGKFIFSTPNYGSFFPLIERIWDYFGKAKKYMKEGHKTKFYISSLEKLLKMHELKIEKFKTILFGMLIICVCEKY